MSLHELQTRMTDEMHAANRMGNTELYTLLKEVILASLAEDSKEQD
ncbi:MAG: hypothetical protein HUU29_05815 [Planctomycetaceae bacterium]|nr:hypothetical protein [Planctomycetaceae bacterium]